MNDEFYIGYRKVAPPRLARFVAVVAGSVAVAVIAAALMAGGAQQPAGNGSFAFGNPETIEGTVHAEPVLHIAVSPGDHAALVVDQGKHGPPEYVTRAAGKRIRMQSTRIERDGLVLLETKGPDEFEVVGDASSGESALEQRSESIQLTGELVDTKCYLGVMNPGRGKVHRGCAAECLRGGVPPGLLIREPDGTSRVIVLQPADGAATVNPEWAARTIVVGGVLHQIDGLDVLTYERLELSR